MATNEEWGRRLRSARRRYEEETDSELSYREIGERLGTALKRSAYKHTSVRSWFVEGQEPDSLAVMRELAVLLKVDPRWLAFGDDVNRTHMSTTDVPRTAEPTSRPEMGQGQIVDLKPARPPTSHQKKRRSG